MNYKEEINDLKSRTYIEWVLDWFKKSSKYVIIGSLSLVLIMFFMFTVIPWINYSWAKSKVDKAKKELVEFENHLKSSSKLLTENSKYYKEKDFYQQKLKEKYTFIPPKKLILDSLDKEKDYKKINTFFSSNLAKDFFKITPETKKLVDEILWVKNIQEELKNRWVKHKNFYSKSTKVRSKKIKLNNKSILDNTNYNRVKIKSKSLYEYYFSSNKKLVKYYNSIDEFNEKSIGKYNKNQLDNIVSDSKKLESFEKLESKTYSSFIEYYDLLIDQYYDEVIKNYVDYDVNYHTEDNPDYEEWTEQEPYMDTETYYETESYTDQCSETKTRYVTVIRNGKAVTESQSYTESVPCTKTRQVAKTRQVQKTRTIYKDNGEPETIEVPYTIYTFYYVVERTNKGSSQSNNISKEFDEIRGDNPGEPPYSYPNEHKKGWIVWKEKWNDQITRGFNINPKLK